MSYKDQYDVLVKKIAGRVEQSVFESVRKQCTNLMQGINRSQYPEFAAAIFPDDIEFVGSAADLEDFRKQSTNLLAIDVIDSGICNYLEFIADVAATIYPEQKEQIEKEMSEWWEVWDNVSRRAQRELEEMREE